MLTHRETAVLLGRLRGLTVKEVAAELGISCYTARFHIRALYRKLKAHSLQQAVLALQGGRCRRCRYGPRRMGLAEG